MPAAVETSKRKFHRLLENISTSTSHNAAAISEKPEYNSPAPKRVRLGPEDSEVEVDGVANATIVAVSSAGRPNLRQIARASTRNKANKAEAPAAKRKPPNYVPWSHELFLARLKTFAEVRSWTSKPDRINEVRWAMRGWTCDGVNRVACKGGCERRLAIVLRPRRKNELGKEIEESEDFSVGISEELVEKYAQLIIDGHGEGCLWRINGCGEDIYRLPIARPAVWQPQLKERYQSFARIAADLPQTNRLSFPVNLHITLSHLPQGFFSEIGGSNQSGDHVSTNEEGSANRESQSNQELTNRAALAFALLGWHGSLSSPGYALASCDACFRRIGLWLYKSQGVSSQQQNNDLLSEDELRVDLVTNHRDYCPWVNATSQKAVGSFEGLVAWKILQRVIQNAAEFKKSSFESLASGDDVSPARTSTEVKNGGDVARDTQLESQDPEEEDRVRFARLKELTRSMGLKKLKDRFGRSKSATVK